MRGLKPFVQDAVQALAPAQLRLLAETLRVDLRGCDDRDDLERVLTGLVCLDQDTSLGVFLTWLRAADQQQGHSLLASKTPAFNNTFLPAIASSEPAIHSGNNRKKPELDQQPSDRVKDHHLGEEITQHLKELVELETAFKQAERMVHTGTPTFEKLKKFLLELAALRAKEQSTRAFLVRQASVLREKHEEMRAETLHTRAQLDFFVEGFTNLRRRHDVLLQDATRIKAEHETAQDLFVGMSAHDCYFEQLMRNTLWKQMQDNAELQRQLDQAHLDLKAAAHKRRELEKHVSQLKQERGDARKDAHCSKRQLRLYKQRLQQLQQAGGGADGSFFRQQAVALRQSVAALVGLLRDAVVRDTKSQRQTLSKEALRVLQQVLTPGTSEMAPLPPPPKSIKANVSYGKGASEPQNADAELAEPRVFQRAGADASPDLDEVIRGVLLVEGATQGDAAECARIMGEKLKYLPVDVKQTLMQLRRDEENAGQAAQNEAQRQREQRGLDSQQPPLPESPVSGEATEQSLAVATLLVEPPIQPQPALAETVDLRPSPSLEQYLTALKQHVTSTMATHGKRGFVLYNWPFTRNDVNLLQGAGLPVDSVINLEDPTKAATTATSSGDTTPASTAATPSSAPITASTTEVSTPASPTKPGSSTSTPKARAPSRLGAKTATPSAGVRGKTPASPQKAPDRASASPSKAPPKTASPSKAPGSKISPGKTSTSKTATPKSPAKPVSRVTSPTRTTSGAKKRPTVSPSTGKAAQPSPAAATPMSASPAEQQRPSSGSKAAKKKPTPPTAASRLQGLGGLLQPVEPASFPSERVTAILQVLEQQKRRKLAPVVQWDETTRRTNELLAMWAEEIHMLLHEEQENRKPKKATEPATPVTSTAKATPASPSRSANSSKTTPASSQAGGSRSKASSPARTAAGKRSASPAKARTSASSPSKARVAKK